MSSNTIKITNRLPQFIQGVQNNAVQAVASALVTGAAEAAALTPQDSSVLVNSLFKNVRMEGDHIIGTVGYTARYALPVHEAEGKLKGLPRPSGHGVYWGPHGQPEFLRKGFERAKPEIDALIEKALKPKR